jgi:hypothetical protein
MIQLNTCVLMYNSQDSTVHTSFNIELTRSIFFFFCLLALTQSAVGCWLIQAYTSVSFSPACCVTFCVKSSMLNGVCTLRMG